MQLLIEYILLALLVGILGIINLFLMLVCLLFVAYMVELLIEKRLHLIFKTLPAANQESVCPEEKNLLQPFTLPANTNLPLRAEQGHRFPLQGFSQFTFKYHQRVVCLALSLIFLQVACLLTYTPLLFLYF